MTEKQPSREERLKRFDARLKAAVWDVPVPEGLDQRLLERLAAARAEEAPQPAITAPPASISRRRLLWAASAVATSAVVLIAVLGLNRQPAETPSMVVASAVQFFGAELPGPLHQMSEPPPSDYPFSRDVLPTAQVRWRPIDGFLGVSGVAYDLSGPGDPRATLYVVFRTAAGLGDVPPSDPMSTTAGRSAAAWQTDGLVYVLVVEGDSRDYQRYLVLARGPLT